MGGPDVVTGGVRRYPGVNWQWGIWGARGRTLNTVAAQRFLKHIHTPTHTHVYRHRHTHTCTHAHVHAAESHVC